MTGPSARVESEPDLNDEGFRDPCRNILTGAGAQGPAGYVGGLAGWR